MGHCISGVLFSSLVLKLIWIQGLSDHNDTIFKIRAKGPLVSAGVEASFQSLPDFHDDCALRGHTIFLQQQRVHNFLLIVSVIEKQCPCGCMTNASIDIILITRRDRVCGEQTTTEKQRVSLTGVYVWGVNSRVTEALRLLCLKGHGRVRGSML